MPTSEPHPQKRRNAMSHAELDLTAVTGIKMKPLKPGLFPMPVSSAIACHDYLRPPFDKAAGDGKKMRVEAAFWVSHAKLISGRVSDIGLNTGVGLDHTSFFLPSVTRFKVIVTLSLLRRTIRLSELYACKSMTKTERIRRGRQQHQVNTSLNPILN